MCKSLVEALKYYQKGASRYTIQKQTFLFYPLHNLSANVSALTPRRSASHAAEIARRIADVTARRRSDRPSSRELSG